jgi:uncharacterized metal-binding protein YceD (DUF177 family)
MALADAAAVIAEGKLYQEQFDLATDELLAAYVEERVNRAAAFLTRQVGADVYADTDAAVVAILTEAEVYLACARCFRTIRNLAVTYDHEALPPEHVDGRVINEEIAHDYELKAAELIAQFDGGAYLDLLRGNPHRPAGDQAAESNPLPWDFRVGGVS